MPENIQNTEEKESNTHNKLEPNTSKTEKQAPSKKKHTLYTAHTKK